MTMLLKIDLSTYLELSRHPRKPSVWKRLGITLADSTIVSVRPDYVLLQHT